MTAGCGGSTSNNGNVSGVVFDISGQPVRGATVYTGDKFQAQTTTNSSGTYYLQGVQAEFATVHATITVNGTTYFGQNLLQVFNGEQTKSVNIVVVNQSTAATISGTVYDRSGNAVSGAQVFAFAQNGLSSTNAISDNNGNYTLSYLEPGVQYTLQASARGFDGDTTVDSLNTSENRNINFNLSNPSGATVAAPGNVLATAYTSPASRVTNAANAYTNLKRLLFPKRKVLTTQAAKTRLTPSGNYTEVDVTWNQVQDTALLGFGVYRTLGTGTPNQNVDYLHDPLATIYEDFDTTMLVGQTYTYYVTSLNTLYGYSGGVESQPSAASSATILGDMVTGIVDPTTPTFNWQAASGATQYEVFLFDQFPDIGVNQIWDTSSAPTSGLSQAYNGSGQLISGHTYYYIVVGRNSDGSGVTFSDVNSFVKS